MVVIVKPKLADDVLAQLKAAGEASWVLGQLAKGEGKVVYR
jgi:phosphoribosylaminoimidazole (AIR) synthetase